MIKLAFLILAILIFANTFGQRDKSLPSVDGNRSIISDSDYTKLKIAVLRTTGYVIDKHPLIWAKEQIETNLLKTDTLINLQEKRKYIYYYNKTSQLFQIIILSTDSVSDFIGSSVYDSQYNLIFREWVYKGNVASRIRRGYDENNLLLFECYNYPEVARLRLTMMKKFKKPINYKKNVCNCDF